MSPQRTPTLFQACTSSAGLNLAGKHAGGIYCGGLNIEHVRKYADSIRQAAKKHGRDPSSIKLFAGMSPNIERTMEEAVVKYKMAEANVSAIPELAIFCNFTNIDPSKWGMIELFSMGDDAEGVSIQGVVKNFQGMKKNTP